MSKPIKKDWREELTDDFLEAIFFYVGKDYNNTWSNEDFERFKEETKGVRARAIRRVEKIEREAKIEVYQELFEEEGKHYFDDVDGSGIESELGEYRGKLMNKYAKEIDKLNKENNVGK